MEVTMRSGQAQPMGYTVQAGYGQTFIASPVARSGLPGYGQPLSQHFIPLPSSAGTRHLAPIHESDLQRATITITDLQLAVRSTKNNISPGPNGVPNEAIKLLASKRPELLISIYNICIREGHFPTIWKKAHLVLLQKGDKPLRDPSFYRPLCLLVSAAKLL